MKVFKSWGQAIVTAKLARQCERAVFGARMVVLNVWSKEVVLSVWTKEGGIEQCLDQEDGIEQCLDQGGWY